jgi:hypothetical protein
MNVGLIRIWLRLEYYTQISIPECRELADERSELRTSVRAEHCSFAEESSYPSSTNIQSVRGGKSTFWGVTVTVILTNCIHTCVVLRTASEIELFHIITRIKEHQIALRRATRHVLTRVAKCIDVDNGIFENVLY